ncbi:MAG: 2Fe-2S iron-sulfur cluster binding domain-containing protein [Pirellulales bacterium]|nr:2Fe-2S iron-sulfur cluster binding domain-containing protein [Pirellulales bacterium]
MLGRLFGRSQAGWLVGSVLIAAATTFAGRSYAQISPEEHAKHHPGQAQPGATTGQPSTGMGAMMEGEMGGMMEGMMGGGAQRSLFPSLMDMGEFTPEQRQQVQQQANERMRDGLSLLSQGLGQLAGAAEANDLTAMQAAAEQMRVGLARLESGAAVDRALAEGEAPSEVALDWFKREMRLAPPPAAPAAGGVLGLSWFHFFLMAFLIIFATVMIWMYFHKMQRAAVLLQGLTGGAPPSAGGGAGSIPPPTRASPNDDRPALPIRSVAYGDVTPKKWSGNLRISRVFQEAPDVKTFRLMNPLGGPLPFSYLPGQFITVAVPIDGKLVKRSYTLASSPTQHDFAEITVKHEEGGEVSGFLHERTQEGDLLAFSGPSGAFIFTGRECKCILLIGGGVGITPLMSVLRYLTDRSWPGDIYLLYGCHAPQDIIFREELDYLQRRHPNLHIVISVTHPEGTDWKGPTGRIAKEMIAQTVPDIASRYVHLCGPVPLMEAIKKALLELGVPEKRIKTEAFGLALGKPEPSRALAAPTGGGAEATVSTATLPTVSFSLSNKAGPLPPDKTVLDVADEIGVEIDNSCRVGTCGTCRVKLLSGQVTMAVEDGLEPGDKESNIILACQAKTTGDVVVEA